MILPFFLHAGRGHGLAAVVDDGAHGHAVKWMTANVFVVVIDVRYVRVQSNMDESLDQVVLTP